MSSILSRFRIEGLHNIRTIDIPIDDNKLILVGENGTGKSTVANFIYFLLTAQWSRMLGYEFKRILAVVNSREYQFSRDDIRNLAILPNKLRRHPPFLLRSIRSLLNIYHLEKPENQIKMISSDLSVSPRIVKQVIGRINDEEIVSETLKEKARILTSSTKDQVLYLPTYRRIEQDLETIFPELGRRIRDTRERYSRKRQRTNYLELVEFGMDDVENTINLKMFAIKEGVRKALNNLTGTYLRDMIQGAFQNVEASQLQELDDITVDEIFKRIPEEILTEKDKETLRIIIAEINQTGQVGEKNKVIAHFLTKLIEINQKQQDDERDVREFVSTCKGYLSGKHFIYDDVSFDIAIIQDSENEHSQKLAMQALSSGEKQIVSLFSHLYLSRKSDFFMIIDEPELSLSVPWQKQFLPDILKRCNGLIAVTHSPFIFDNELRPYAHSLEEFIEPYEYDASLEDSQNELRPYAHSLEEFIEPYEYDASLEDSQLYHLLEDERLF